MAKGKFRFSDRLRPRQQCLYFLRSFNDSRLLPNRFDRLCGIILTTLPLFVEFDLYVQASLPAISGSGSLLCTVSFGNSA